MKKKLTKKLFITNLLLLLVIALVGVKIIELYLVYRDFQKFNSPMSYNLLNITGLNYSDSPVVEVLDDSKYIIVDIREPVEYKRRHVKGAINVRMGDIFRDNNTLEYLRNLSKERTLALYCYQNKYSEVGDGRSGLVAQYLLANNISAKVITGGISGIPRNLGLLNTDDDFIINDVPKIGTSNAESKCIFTLVGNVVKLETYNETFEVRVGVVYLTSKEWDKLLQLSSQETCHVVCSGRGSCYYGNIFGLNLEMQGGKYEGYVVV